MFLRILIFLDHKFFLTKYFFHTKFFRIFFCVFLESQRFIKTTSKRPNLPNQTCNTKLSNQIYQTKPTKPTKPYLKKQLYQTKPSKLYLPNQTYQAEPARPNLPNQTYHTKPTIPNLPNQAYQTKPNLQNQNFQRKKIKSPKLNSCSSLPELGTAQPQLVLFYLDAELILN